MGNVAVVYQSDTDLFLYVANFVDGVVDVFDRDRRQVSSFTDPDLSTTFAPFDLQVVDGSLFVAFFDRDVFRQDPSAKLEHGVIVEFDLDGVLLDRAIFRPRRGVPPAKAGAVRPRACPTKASPPCPSRGDPAS